MKKPILLNLVQASATVFLLMTSLYIAVLTILCESSYQGRFKSIWEFNRP